MLISNSRVEHKYQIDTKYRTTKPQQQNRNRKNNISNKSTTKNMSVSNGEIIKGETTPLTANVYSKELGIDKNPFDRKFKVFKYITLSSSFVMYMGIYLVCIEKKIIFSYISTVLTCSSLFCFLSSFQTHCKTRKSLFALATLGPLIQEDLKISTSEFGVILTTSRLVRLIPKLLSGFIVDAFSAKLMFVAGTGITALGTIAFALPIFGSRIWYLTMCWSAMNIATTVCWPALVKIAGRWSHSNEIGRVLGVLSLSYLFGDGLTRGFLSLLVLSGLSWRWIMYISSSILLLITLLGMAFLRSSPKSIGRPEPDSDPRSVEVRTVKERIESEPFLPSAHDHSEQSTPAEQQEQRQQQEQSVPQVAATDVNKSAGGEEKEEDNFSLRKLGPRKFFMVMMWPIFSSGSFWLLGVVYFGLTMIRYVFNDWFAIYMFEVGHTPKSVSAIISVVFPVSGGIGVVVMGWLQDRLSPLKRKVAMLVFEAVVMVWLFGLLLTDLFVNFSINENPWAIALPIVLYTLIGFSLLAPYSLPAASLSVRFGGKHMSATLSGLMDGIGSVGSIVSGLIGGFMLDGSRGGWSMLFGAQMICCAVILFFTILYILAEVRQTKMRKKRGESLEQ